MVGKRLDGMRVAILVTDYFEQAELTEPKKALDEAGAITKIVAPKGGQVTAFKHDAKGDVFKVDMTLDEANPGDFDAVLLPGGVLNADKLRMELEARDFVVKIDAADKPVAVICHGPWLLVSAGLVSGRTMTSYYTVQDDIRNAGGHWVNLEVVRDRNWVSSRMPADIPAFNKTMVELFAEHAARLQPVG